MARELAAYSTGSLLVQAQKRAHLQPGWRLRRALAHLQLVHFPLLPHLQLIIPGLQSAMLREQIHAPLSLQDGWLGNLQGHHPNLRVWGRSCHLHQAQSSTFVQYLLSGSSPSSRSCKSLDQPTYACNFEDLVDGRYAHPQQLYLRD
eukprot:COSAG03_NODE_5940_length_1144_cov_5.297608_1_plen_147_part_00